MDLIKAIDSLILRVTLNICYFLIPIHFGHTLCTEKSICSKASETKPNIFVKGGNFGIKSSFGNPGHVSINQSINVYSFQQPYLIFQEKKAFTVATLEVSQASKSVNMHRDLKLSYIRWCDKLGISTTTVANIEMVPRTLGVNS